MCDSANDEKPRPAGFYLQGVKFASFIQCKATNSTGDGFYTDGQATFYECSAEKCETGFNTVDNSKFTKVTAKNNVTGVNLRKQSRHKIGRNQPCPCGSGKKFKKCCGA